jgi:hypothetical protein
VSGQLHVPVALSRWKEPPLSIRRVGGPQSRSGQRGEETIVKSTESRAPTPRSARSRSPYRLLFYRTTETQPRRQWPSYYRCANLKSKHIPLAVEVINMESVNEIESKKARSLTSGSAVLTAFQNRTHKKAVVGGGMQQFVLTAQPS